MSFAKDGSKIKIVKKFFRIFTITHDFLKVNIRNLFS